MPRFRLDRFTLLLVVIAAVGMAHILIRTSPYGAMLSNDAPVYIAGAENLAAGAGFRAVSGNAIVVWPPLFSMLLAFFALFGIEPADSGRFLNIAVFGLTILLAGLWLRRNIGSRILALAGAAAVMTSWPINDVSSRVMADPLFILFTVLASMQLGTFLDRKNSASILPLASAGLFAALAPITRYPGVTVLFAGGLAILMKWEMPVARRLKAAAAWGAASSVPLAVLLARNWSLSGTLTGQRIPSSGLFPSDMLSRMAEEFLYWLVPATSSGSGHLPWAAVGLVAMGGAALVVTSRHKQKQQFHLSPILPFVVFVSVYLAFLVVVVPLTVDQGIDMRYLAPVHVPIILAAAYLLDGFLHIEARGGVAAVKWAAASAMALTCCASIGFNMKFSLDSTIAMADPEYEGGFNYPNWKNSETTLYARANPGEGQAYSNAPEALHLSAGASMPVKLAPWLPAPSDCLLWLRQVAQAKSAYIVWWNRKGCAPSCCEIPDLESQFLERAAKLSDGSVYRLRVPDAVFSNDGAPEIGKAFGVSLAPHVQAAAGPETWQWERGCDGEGWTKVSGNPESAPEYTPAQEDAGLRLRAWTHYTTADGRRLKTATTPSKPVGVPTPIGNLAAQADSFNSLTLTWTPPTTPCPTFTGYQVEYRPAGGEWSRMTLGAAAAGARLEELQVETAYDLRVRAVTGWNEGPWSQARAATDTFSSTRRSLKANNLLAGAAFDIYLHERKLIYVKEPCSQADIEARFFLHVIPADVNDLPEQRRKYGFDNLDFTFDRRGARIEGQCMASVRLPEYAFTAIATGQHAHERPIWKETFSFPGKRRRQSEMPDE